MQEEDEVVPELTREQKKLIKHKGRIQGTLFDTSEEELIISVAFTFAMLKTPAALSTLFNSLNSHFPTMMSIIYAFMALSMAAYTLLAGFAIHLFIRSSWVALMGIHSVFPEGILWEKTSAKPIQVEVSKKTWYRIEELIVITDKVSSSILAMTFSFFISALVLMFYYAVGSIFLLVAVNMNWLDPGIANFLGFVLYATPFIPKLISSATVYLVTPPVEGEEPSKAYKRWEACEKLGNALLASPITGVIPGVITTHYSKKTYGIISFGLMALVITMIFGNVLPSDRILQKNFNYWQGPHEREINTAAYQHQRSEEDWNNTHPFVSEQFVRQPYWMLHLPYFPKYERYMLELCPDLPRAQADEVEKIDAFFDCFTQFYRITLNGEPLPEAEWFFQRHPQRNYRSVSGILPREALRKGHNVIYIERGNVEKNKDMRRFYIHIWVPE
jgi:hypothetical protein